MSGSQQGLFRRESFQSGNIAGLGRPTIALGLPVSLSAAASLTLAIGLVAMLVCGSYTRRVDLSGIMLPQSGLVVISAPATGWVRRLGVTEGATVQEGTLLYTIDVDTSIKDGGVQQSIISALTVQRTMLSDEIRRRRAMATETAKQLTQTIENLKAQLDQLGEQTRMQETFEARLKEGYTQYLALFQQHTVPGAEMDARQQAWMSAQSSLQELRSSSLRLRGELINAQYKAATNPITVSNEIDDLKRKISAIDQDLASSEARRSIEIRAPSAGTVTAIAAQVGQVVSTATRLLTIVPNHDSMIGQLLAPSTAVGFIHPGERVAMRYSGFPYQRFGQYGGTVVSVSRAALQDEEVRQWLPGNGPDAPVGPFYRVTVSPDRQSVTAFGGEQRIPANMRVNAYVLLDSRPLYQWILEPLYSVGRPWRTR